MQRSKKKPKRKYYRKCGLCGNRQEQSDMIRVKNEVSENGWACRLCFQDLARKYFAELDYEEEV